MEVLRPDLACVVVKIIFEKQERRGRKKKIGIKGANTGASHDRLSTSPAACG